MSITFRKMSGNDIPLVSEIFQESFQAPPWNETWTLSQAEARLKEYLSSPLTDTCLILKDGTILGCSIGHQLTFQSGLQFILDEFFIAPKVQGNHLGTLLMEHVKEILRKKNITQIILMSEKDYPCIEFYQKNGLELSTHTMVLEEKL